MLPISIRQKIEAVSAGLDNGTRALIEKVNQRYEEKQKYYRQLSSLQNLTALLGGEGTDEKLLEEQEKRTFEALLGVHRERHAKS